jgi:predicted small lipoprotein YifL
MKETFQSPLVLAALTLLVGCGTPMMMPYLESARGQATQEEVKERFGQPVKEARLENGTTLWTYRHLSYNPDPPFGVESCVDYTLTFDAKHVLREWTAKEGNC